MSTNIATVVDFERVASDKVWAELDTANKRIAALEESLRDCARAPNARLIAAAPELLEAAQVALNYIENTESELGITLRSAEMLRAAIAKAVQS